MAAHGGVGGLSRVSEGVAGSVAWPQFYIGIVFAICCACIANSCGHVQYLMCANNTHCIHRDTYTPLSVLCVALGWLNCWLDNNQCNFCTAIRESSN